MLRAMLLGAPLIASRALVMRNESGASVNEGDLRDGMVYWRDGKRSWLAREGPGVLVGDIGTGKHYYFRRNENG